MRFYSPIYAVSPAHWNVNREDEMEPNSPIRSVSPTTGERPPAAGTSVRRHLAIMASILTLLLALLGCALADTQGTKATNHVTPTAAKGVSPSVYSGPHPAGFVPNTKALPASQASFSAAKLAAVDLSAYTPPVGEQGAVNSCTAWATGYYLRGWYAKRDGYYSSDFTAMYTYSQIALAHGDFSTNANSGSTFKENLDIQVSQGIDTALDYHANKATPVLPTSAQRVNAAAYKIAGYTDIFNDSTASFAGWIKATLASGNPIAIGFPIYPEFKDAAKTSGYVAAPTSGETSEGLHATFVYGYDQNGLRIENQWGDSWGNHGRGVLSWDFVNRYAHEAISITPPSRPTSWQQLPGGATDISVGGTNSSIFHLNGGEIWAIGTTPVSGGYGIYHWNPFTWTWDVANGGAVHIAIGLDESPWIVDSFGNIFRWTGGAWKQMPGSARDIAVGDDNSVWVIGWTLRDNYCRPGPCDGGIYHWTGSDWQQIPGSANRITVDNFGHPWVVTRGGSVYHWTGSNLQLLPGAATDIACGGGGAAGSDCWITGTDGNIYRWHSTKVYPERNVESGYWVAVSRSTAVAIAVGPSSNPWVVNSGGSILEYVD
jgi:hypothetical protein